MQLIILFKGGREEQLSVQRVTVVQLDNPSGFSIGAKNEMLYYERPGQPRGYGKKLPMSDIECWECWETVE